MVAVAIGAGGIIWGLYTHFFTLAELRASIAEEKASTKQWQEISEVDEENWEQALISRVTAIKDEIAGTRQSLHNLENTIRDKNLFPDEEQSALTEILSNMERLEKDADNFVKLLEKILL